jgi:hypothetical protein
MDSIERFYATIERKEVDRPAAWLGLPHSRAQQGLFDHYRVKDLHELKLAVGDDFYAVDLPYHSDYSDAIYAAFDWYLDGKVDAVDRTLTADGCFKDCEEIEDLAFFKWPDPVKYVDPEECRALVDRAPKDKTVLGVSGQRFPGGSGGKGAGTAGYLSHRAHHFSQPRGHPARRSPGKCPGPFYRSHKGVISAGYQSFG